MRRGIPSTQILLSTMLKPSFYGSTTKKWVHLPSPCGRGLRGGGTKLQHLEITVQFTRPLTPSRQGRGDIIASKLRLPTNLPYTIFPFYSQRFDVKIVASNLLTNPIKNNILQESLQISCTHICEKDAIAEIMQKVKMAGIRY
ncbi:MAG: hypothetical protein Q7T53_11040 [Deltaproteobacteria bacterium]|nr:hypothetical protein [Deltaproteobacteria bacterium]